MKTKRKSKAIANGKRMTEPEFKSLVRRSMAKLRNTDETPAPRFEVTTAVKVPATVADTCVARIVGRMWGPNEREGRSNGWIYLLSFAIGNGFWSPWFMATEEELVGWGCQK